MDGWHGGAFIAAIFVYICICMYLCMIDRFRIECLNRRDRIDTIYFATFNQIPRSQGILGVV
jgi:hypothetical protein